MGVEHQGGQRLVDLLVGRRDALDDGPKDLFDPLPGLGRAQHGLLCSRTFSTSAAGRSILLITGMIV